MNSFSTMKPFAIAALLAALLGGCASMSSAPARYSNGVLTNEAGMTLYTFDKDSGGKSVCNDKCAVNWPPFIAAADAAPAGGYTIIVRDDGRRQWAWQGKPLYLWIKDQKAGDTTGDNVGTVWHVVKQSGGY
jgi:predicted lipoprotein with Yx(FWY)xxD motif